MEGQAIRHFATYTGGVAIGALLLGATLSWSQTYVDFSSKPNVNLGFQSNSATNKIEVQVAPSYAAVAAPIFSDDFNTSTLDLNKWHLGANAGNQSAVVNNALQLRSQNSVYESGWVVTRNAYSARNTTIAVKVIQPNNDGDLGISPTYNLSSIYGFYNEANFYRFYTYRNTSSGAYFLYVEWKKNGVLNGFDVTGNLVINGAVYLRLRCDDVKIHFEASLDGATWTDTYNETFALPSYTLDTPFYYELAGYKTWANGALVVDDFSITPQSTDTQPPQISAVAAQNITGSSAQITWQTDEAADSQVEYGLTTGYGSSSPLNSTLVTSHAVVLSSLQTNTTYHYRVKSKDAAGNLAMSGDFTFTTSPNDVTPPAISNVAANNMTSSAATINWNTNEAADSQVEYGLTTSYGSSSPLNPALVTSHAVTLSGLQSNTTYHYRVKSKDAAGNLAVSNDFIFQTSASPNERIVLNDPLNNNTLGTRTGGQFVSGGGWQVTSVNDMLVYDLGRYVESGVCEVQVRNFSPSTQNTYDRHHLLSIFRNPWGNHHPVENQETVWDLHAGFNYDPGVKMLSWTYDGNEVNTTVTAPWILTQTYQIQVAWNGNQLQYFRDGALSATHTHSAAMQLRYLFVGRDLTVSADLVTNFRNNQYSAVIGPIYSNLVVKENVSSGDVSPPQVANIATSVLYANAARLAWTTNEPAVCYVEYGLTTAYGQKTPALGPPTQSFSAALANLTSNQTYHYRIVALDDTGNLTTSVDQTFTTLQNGIYLFKPAADTYVEQAGLYGTTRDYGNFGWMNLLSSAGRECYLRFNVSGLSGNVAQASLRLHGRQTGNSGGTLRVLTASWDENNVTWLSKPNVTGQQLGTINSVQAGQWHEVSATPAITGNGVYNFALIGSGTAVVSFDSRESTNSQPELIVTISVDTTPPNITNVSANNLSTTSAAISWTTNEIADSQVEYGVTTGYGSSTALDPALVTSHAVALSGLTANTTYHYRVKSRDAAGNLVVSGDFTFTTLQGASNQVAVYEIYQITLTAANAGSNPYVDGPAVTVTFTGTSGAAQGQSLTRRGFWDGGSTYHVSFAPTATGNWSWNSSSSDAGLNGKSATVICSGTLPSGHASARGYIHESPAFPYTFQYDDGTPFFIMGDTQWSFSTDAVSWPGEFKTYVDARSAQGFNYVHGQMYPIYPDGNDRNEGGQAFISNNVDLLNPGFWQIFDQRLAYLNQKGIVGGLLLAWANQGWQQFSTQQQVDRFVQYVVNRYAAYNIIWITAGEYEEASPPGGHTHLGEFLKSADPYGHPITTHTLVTSADDFGNAAWHTTIYQQTSDPQLITSDRQYNKPVINSEFGYEGDQSAENVRKDAWEIVMRGGFLVYGDTATFHYNAHMTHDYLYSAGAAFMTILKNFWTDNGQYVIEWWRFSRFQSLGNFRWLAGKPGVEYVVYVDNTGAFTINLSDASGVINGQWFNTTTGQWGTTFSGNVSASFSLTPPGSGYAAYMKVGPDPSPALTLISPNGGESWTIGNTQNITWSSTGTLPNVKLEFSVDNGGNWTTIIASTANDGSANWTIPNNVSNQCLVRVSDAADGNPADVSDAMFAIVAPPAPTLTLASPNGGESWTVGAVQNIIWNSTGTLPNVKLEFSVDNGVNWTTIAASTANDGSENWTVPNNVSNQSLVRVSDAADGNPADVSDAVFAIVAPPQPTLTLTSPNGGESWTVGTVQNITWNSTGTLPNVKLEFSADNDANWATIIASTANDGNESWTIPNNVSSLCLVRVSDAADGDPVDVSDVVFAIVAPPAPTLTLTSPNGGESWTVGTVQNITWNSTGTLPNVKLEFSADNGANWATIIASTANDGNESWTIPNDVSSQCLVRISDATDGSPADVSNAVFSIIAASSAPTIISFAPTSGPVGTEVTIIGTTFTGVTSVTFNGTNSTNFIVDSGTQIRATVPIPPPGGTTTGKISVTNPAGTGSSTNDFIVATIFTFNPSDDAYVRSDQTSSNFGTATTLRMKQSSPITNSYLKYVVSGVTGSVQSAKLRIKVTVASSSGGSAYTVSNNYRGISTAWLQSGLNYNNAPTISGMPLSTIGSVTVGQVVEFDVKPAITGNGTFSFGLKNSSSTTVQYNSKEGATKPELVIQTGPVIPSLSINVVTVTEGNTGTVNAVFTVSLSTASSQVVTVAYATANGTATAGNDYVAGSGIVTFPAGTTTQPITIPVVGDAVAESNETFLVNLASSTNATIADAQGQGTINDDDMVTITLNPTDDTYVRSDQASSNYGTATTLRMKQSSPITNSYLKFLVNGVNGAVLSAKLRLKVTVASSSGGSVYSVSNNNVGTSTPWTQSGLNYNNAPSISGTALSTIGSVTVNQVVEFDVKSAIAGNGTFSFGLKNSSSTTVQYNSKEGATKPELVIQFGTGTTAKMADLGPEAIESQNNEMAPPLPESFVLLPNYPNPFNAETRIAYQLPERSHVKLVLHDLMGRELKILTNEEREAGTHEVGWNGRDASDNPLSSGIYIYSLHAGSFRGSKKLLLVK